MRYYNALTWPQNVTINPTFEDLNFKIFFLKGIAFGDLYLKRASQKSSIRPSKAY